MILDSSVERVQVCGFWIAWLGATRRMAVPCNEEQHDQAAQKPYNWIRSRGTHWAKPFETIHANNHTAF